MSEIKEFRYKDYKWKQTEECAGFVISGKNCEYRASELEVVSYLPEICYDGTVENCDLLISYARFEN